MYQVKFLRMREMLYQKHIFSSLLDVYPNPIFYAGFLSTSTG